MTPQNGSLLPYLLLLIPIIGARKISQLNDNLRSLDVTLSQAQLQRLDRASAVSMDQSA